MFVGIDPSLAGTGVVGIRWGPIELVYTREVKIDSRPRTWMEQVDRINQITDMVREILNRMLSTWGIESLVLEGYSYGSRFQAHQLGELGFSLRNLLATELPYKSHIIPPTVIKKVVTGNGRASKSYVKETVEHLAGMSFGSHNLSDACACAIVAAHVANFENLSWEQRKPLVRYVRDIENGD